LNSALIFSIDCLLHEYIRIRLLLEVKFALINEIHLYFQNIPIHRPNWLSLF